MQDAHTKILFAIILVLCWLPLSCNAQTKTTVEKSLQHYIGANLCQAFSNIEYDCFCLDSTGAYLGGVELMGDLQKCLPSFIGYCRKVNDENCINIGPIKPSVDSIGNLIIGNTSCIYTSWPPKELVKCGDLIH